MRRFSPAGRLFSGMVGTATVGATGGAAFGDPSRLGVSGENQQPPIGRGHPHIHHLDRGHFLQHRSRSQSRRQSPQALPQGDVQTIGQEGYEDVRFDARVLLVIKGPDRQIAFQGAKDRFDLGELHVVLPQPALAPALPPSHRRGPPRPWPLPVSAAAGRAPAVALAILAVFSRDFSTVAVAWRVPSANVPRCAPKYKVLPLEPAASLLPTPSPSPKAVRETVSPICSVDPAASPPDKPQADRLRASRVTVLRSECLDPLPRCAGPARIAPQSFSGTLSAWSSHWCSPASLRRPGEGRPASPPEQ